MYRLKLYMQYLKKKAITALLAIILATIAGCNLNQGAGEQMVNLEKVSDDGETQLANLTTAIARNRQDASLYSRRAKIYLKKDDLEKALADVNKAIELNKNEMGYLFLKAQVLRAMGNVKESLPLALKAERNSYQSVSLYVLLSDLYLQHKEPQQAAIYASKALALAPRNEYALYYNGRVAEVTGDTARASNNYRLALREAPDFAEARRELAGALINLKLYSEAAVHITKAMKQVPKDAQLWFYRGQYYEAIQKSDSALWSYTKAISLADTLQNAQYQAGQLLYMRGDNAGAISHLEKAAKEFGHHIKYITILASAYERTGQNIKALEQYQRLDALQPGYTFADQSIARLKAKLTRPAPIVADTAGTTE
ncbi:tetratricopeptide repeat protein [Pontibacter sp. KCTC 32443]|uniref:tetratricopeptide repeat protein n=1 Tax=Pontibacter TaxID=323449 RepID=UPI00164E3926|nr:MULTISPECIES: tetratricopeptide repeat protein [Pontibacter]MBC5773291.1 tetratricopeptide repeat protein [Pontibacter sp. KCTC 32443]